MKKIWKKFKKNIKYSKFYFNECKRIQVLYMQVVFHSCNNDCKKFHIFKHLLRLNILVMVFHLMCILKELQGFIINQEFL